MSIRYLFVLLSLLTFSFFYEARADGGPWFTAKENMSGTKYYYELTGGLSYSNTTFDNTDYNLLKQKPQILPDAGLGFRIQMKRWISIIPRLTYSPNGLYFSEEAEYKMKLNYAKFSLPFDIQFMLGNKNKMGTSSFFIYAGPYIALPISEEITVDDYSTTLKMSDLVKPDYGIEGGFGFRIPTFSLEGRTYMTLRLLYSRGFVDTYSLAETTVNPSLNDQMYLDGGKRFNGAIKFVVDIEIPVRNRKMISFTAGGDGKKNYKRVVIIDEK